MSLSYTVVYIEGEFVKNKYIDYSPQEWKLESFQSESNFTLASEDLYSPRGENMQNDKAIKCGLPNLDCMWAKLFLRTNKQAPKARADKIWENYVFCR